MMSASIYSHVQIREGVAAMAAKEEMEAEVEVAVAGSPQGSSSTALMGLSRPH